MKKTLIIMRHAQAGYGRSDRLRELTDYGRQQALSMGSQLSQLIACADLAYVSGAVRTRQTLEGLKSGGLAVSEVDYRDSFYEGYYQDILDALYSTHDQRSTVLVIGHEPSVSGLVSYLGEPSDETVRSLMRGFSPACAGAMTFSGQWHKIDEDIAGMWQRILP
ncbi:SixA phosphatase family protein [Arcanobacterium buesumense]|uniref:Phosphoglycerate mutase n=1 Tax=Arcanobacterium buesumense TaxID=2722751 RepID=A0A6H2EL29_9ACTO|nr:histidine phosphatase family protein [Arcanobacterium buesumense]QJC21833.1 phosphoglycerate mutase [Arcanobacterium buesumense]